MEKEKKRMTDAIASQNKFVTEMVGKERQHKQELQQATSQITTLKQIHMDNLKVSKTTRTRNRTRTRRKTRKTHWPSLRMILTKNAEMSRFGVRLLSQSLKFWKEKGRSLSTGHQSWPKS